MTVATLQTEVKETRRDATERAVSTDLVASPMTPRASAVARSPRVMYRRRSAPPRPRLLLQQRPHSCAARSGSHQTVVGPGPFGSEGSSGQRSRGQFASSLSETDRCYRNRSLVKGRLHAGQPGRTVNHHNCPLNTHQRYRTSRRSPIASPLTYPTPVPSPQR